MPSRRSLIAMTDDEAHTYVREPGHIMTLGTIQASGVPHLVALFYGFTEDGRIGVLTYARSQKVKNLQRDPRFSALIESGNSYDQLRGIHMTGTVELNDDPDFMRALMTSTTPRYPQGPVGDDEESAAKVLALRVAVLLDVEKSHSWDHRKLGGTY